jgi:DNA-binding MarR family transcriptional regulator
MSTVDPSRQTARRVLQLMPRWHRWAAATLQASHLDQELSLRQLGVLYLIQGGLTSPGQLARRLWVTPAVVTGLLDRLEQRGFVRREIDPADRRRLRLELTEAGRATGEALGQILTEELATQLATYDLSQLAELERALDVLEDALIVLAARLPAAGDLCAEDEDAAGDEEPEPASRGLSSAARTALAPVVPRFAAIGGDGGDARTGRGGGRRPARRALASVEG